MTPIARAETRQSVPNAPTTTARPTMILQWSNEKVTLEGEELTSHLTFEGTTEEWLTLLDVTPKLVESGLVRSIERIALKFGVSDEVVP
jgi:hypothetical protein